MRTRIVLRAAEGLSNTAIADELGIAKHAVGKWRERFAATRADGLLDEPRHLGSISASAKLVAWSSAGLPCSPSVHCAVPCIARWPTSQAFIKTTSAEPKPFH